MRIALYVFFLPFILNASDFVLFTQPKSGTHLLIPILSELTGKEVYWAPEYTQTTPLHKGGITPFLQDPNWFVFSLERDPWKKETMDTVWEVNASKGTFLHLHAPYSVNMESYLAERNYINFFIKRDPRDQIVSLLNHYKYIHFNDKAVELIETDDERLLYMIRKYTKAGTIHHMNWLQSPLCCVLEFEKLMGESGGAATLEQALVEMRKIAAALETSLSDQELLRIYNKHYGTGWNFFKGKVGAWKDYFNEEHKALIKEEIGDLLILLGYEKDLDW